MTVVSERLELTSRFVDAGEKWDAQFSWRRYDARITNPGGGVVYKQDGVEFPEGWDQNSVNIVAQKYFWGAGAERETSLKQLITRVVDKIVLWAGRNGTLSCLNLSPEEFWNEIAFMIADQRYAFNSPVWFNVGIEEKPQCSACFILSVEDSMESITENVRAEMMIFKHGSGAGSNRGKLRASVESVKGGGVASGPMSFIRVYDAGAGGIKSGGKTRRAAKMEILDGDHLDIEEFVAFKRNEERKARILVDGGVDGSFCGEAYSTVSGQNANYSVRVDDEFMRMVREDGMYTLRGRHDTDITREIKARDLWELIAQCAWECADPGLQFDGPIQRMNTCADRDRINATNPCSEYVFLDDTSCNLSSHNLLSYLMGSRESGTLEFDIEHFRHAVAISAVAMDAFIDYASYPTEAIEQGTRTFRTLGIGYTGLGALLMHLGLSYDSGEAQLVAGAITSLMGAQAYLTSATMAVAAEPFADYHHNRQSMAEVIHHHRVASTELDTRITDGLDAGMNGAVFGIAQPLARVADTLWESVAKHAADHQGFRNAQVTVLAPTGTISFMMGSQASTGIEPVLGLVTFKNLAGGGVLKQVNPWVEQALLNLGYEAGNVRDLIRELEETGTFKLDDPQHQKVFLTSFADPVTGKSLRWQAHVDMMAACQPFISGAISKTINMPATATVEDIADAYLYAYDKGLKCIAIYRDGSKGVQAIGTSLKTGTSREVAELIDEIKGPGWGERVHLPTTRQSITTKVRIGPDGMTVKGYFIVGLDEEGLPKEIFMNFNTAGGTVQGFMHAWCKMVSFGLQAGIPLAEIVGAFMNDRFEPSGPTRNPDIPSCTSIIDYVSKWLMLQFDPDAYQQLAGARPVRGTSRLTLSSILPEGDLMGIQPEEEEFTEVDSRIYGEHTGRTCSCGAIMVRVGACETCPNCATTTGCG